MRTRPNATTVGRLWVNDSGRVYRQTSFTDNPTATFRPLDPETDERDLTVVVTAPIAEDFRLLLPEGEAS